MSDNFSRRRNRAFILGGLGIALLIAVFLSPLASRDPDGLDRVSQDLKFEDKALKETPAQKLPFSAWFGDYSLRGVPPRLATPLAGLIGTLVVFGLAWGIGKMAIRSTPPSPPSDNSSSPSGDED